MSNIQNYLSPPLAVASGGTGTTTAFTLGSVIFVGDSGVYNQNNANFFWDNTNNRLGIGTASPSVSLQVFGSASVTQTVTGNNGDANLRLEGNNGVATITLVSVVRSWQISSGSGAGLFSISDASAGGNPKRVVIDTSGNIGIGTTIPGQKLHLVVSGTNDDGVKVVQGGTGGAALILTNNDTGGHEFRLLSTGSGNAPGAGTLSVWDQTASAYRLTIMAGGNLGIGTINPSRLLHVAGRYQLGGTAIATTDWALTSGWGANATISAVTGTDSRGTVTVTTSALDTPTANPVITLTFKDGTWTTTPFCVNNMDHASTGPSNIPVTCRATPTTLVISYRGTPTATSALTYTFNYLVVG